MANERTAGAAIPTKKQVYANAQNVAKTQDGVQPVDQTYNAAVIAADTGGGRTTTGVTPSNPGDTSGGGGPSGGGTMVQIGSGGSGGSGNNSGNSGSSKKKGPTEAELLAQTVDTGGLSGTVNPYELPEIDGPNPERINHVDTTEQEQMLQQLTDAQKQQTEGAINYNVDKETEALNRAMEDAGSLYQEQRNQIAADEATAKDNQALYNEARGDRGGIGQSQYNSIQNTAAINRRKVNDAQVKLSTDTARQISDLRAQGEFEKADQLLAITQNYLSQLMSLDRWAMETNLGVDQFNSQLQQWVDQYNLNVKQFLTDTELAAAGLTGVFANGNLTREAQNQINESLINAGTALLNAGVLPSEQQLAAMGMTAEQAKQYIKKMKKK